MSLEEPPKRRESAAMFLQDVLELEELDEGLYRGFTPRFAGLVRIFGGQTIGQALYAAGKTVSDKMTVHSLHSYFLRPGNLELPILYQVKSIRNGRSFCTRLVQATQKGQVIFSLLASFHIWEQGSSHQLEAPEVNPPEILPTQEEVWREIIRLHEEEKAGRKESAGPRPEKDCDRRPRLPVPRDPLPAPSGSLEKHELAVTRAGGNEPIFRDLPGGRRLVRNAPASPGTLVSAVDLSRAGPEPPLPYRARTPGAAEERERAARAAEIAGKLPRLPREVIQHLSLRLEGPLPMETRPADCAYYDYLRREIPVRYPQKRVWIRAAGRLGDQPHIHNCAAAFMSDSGFMGTAFLPHGFSWAGLAEAASLDHSMWFHAPFRADDWLLFVTDSWHAGNALGHNFGRIYDRDGRLVITCAQQGLMRERKPSKL